MAVYASQFILLALGTSVFVASLWGMLKPGALTKFIMSFMGHSYGLYFAVIIRLVLGAAMIVVAPVSRFPLTFHVLGWAAIIAAVALIVIGRERLERLIAWFAASSETVMRLWLVLGLGFGAFLIAGVL